MEILIDINNENTESWDKCNARLKLKLIITELINSGQSISDGREFYIHGGFLEDKVRSFSYCFKLRCIDYYYTKESGVEVRYLFENE